MELVKAADATRRGLHMTKKQIATSLASLLTLMAAVSVTADEVPYRRRSWMR